MMITLVEMQAEQDDNRREKPRVQCVCEASKTKTALVERTATELSGVEERWGGASERAITAGESTVNTPRVLVRGRRA